MSAKEEYYLVVAYLDSVEKCIEEVAKIKRRRTCQKDLSLTSALLQFKEINKEFNRILGKIRSY